MKINQLYNADLESLVQEYEAAGEEWVSAKLEADQLEENQKAFLASIANEMDSGDLTEAKLDRLARGSKKYRDHIAGMCAARADMLRKKVHFDAMDKLFEARRSSFAMEREKVAKGIFHSGRR